ncbi:hypothetical protein BVRB_1g021570 [Beta vulgaris subsp. vulgaris]|uniref:Uncharacterized protein n=1 Tax=Beta vulgaris subsp. vulgaris TaxID=3555 RepID=A0A0J8BHY0_BETVV|nr:hypothetical protein BVRB_1g021570 [Beta vulgaris subsp. vulgaris]
MDERLNSMEKLAKDIEMLAEIVNSNHKGEVASEFDQNDVSNEPNSLPAPYLSDNLAEPIQINESQVNTTSSETWLMKQIAEYTMAEHVNSFVWDDFLMNETSEMVDKQSEENYVKGIYAPTINFENNEDNMSDTLEEICVEQLDDPRHNVLSDGDSRDLGEPCDSLTFKTNFEASFCNLDYIDPISALNTDLLPAPWALILPLPNFCPFQYLLKALKCCRFRPYVIEIVHHRFCLKQEPESSLQQRQNSANHDYICVQVEEQSWELWELDCGSPKVKHQESVSKSSVLRWPRNTTMFSYKNLSKANF